MIAASSMSRPPKPPPPRPPKPPPPPPAALRGTFEEFVAANRQDPFHAARLARLASGERFDDPAVSDPRVREVSVHPACEVSSRWLVEWNDAHGGCYVTTFDGPMAERRAARSKPHG
jgi:hypothetical protein